jgi:hypothetical protein
MFFFVMFVHVFLLMRGVFDSAIYFYKNFYVFDLRAIELFAVFRPLRTPDRSLSP